MDVDPRTCRRCRSSRRSSVPGARGAATACFGNASAETRTWGLTLVRRVSLVGKDRSIRNREPERRSVVHFSLRPDLPSVALDDAVNERQANARAGELVVRVQPLKHTKQPGRVPHVEACAVIPDEKDVRTISTLRSNLDRRTLPVAGEKREVTVPPPSRRS